jgi:glycosyltransferase involved in cell wall biosynthesis/precorrin-6B methylase 2
MEPNILEIVIVAGGMAFGPATLKHKSLGGSETAVIGMAHALRKLGHIITVFCPLPPPGNPDFHENGSMDETGVRWVNIDQYPNFISATEVDLLVASRQPEFLMIPHQAKKAVLWCHDLAIYNGTSQQVMGASWNFDEIWCVSEYHRQQYHKVTGYPLESIRATRNGIIEYDVIPFGRVNRQLVYAARPERGLVNLVRPGGIMSRLPEYDLKVTMYDNFPEHMAPLYGQLFDWANGLPNVEILPPSKQDELRQLISDSVAYVYPTEFEETSCILAREAMSVKTPFITTRMGALPETLGECGVFVASESEPGSDQWCQDFANSVRRWTDADSAHYVDLQGEMSERTDLTWDGVASQWESWAQPPVNSAFSQVWSLVEDSDVIPAIAVLNEMPDNLKSAPILRLEKQLTDLYPYLTGECTLSEYYENYFVREDEKGARAHRSSEGMPRFEAISEQISLLKPHARVLDYGCAEGVIILDLARRNPDKEFYGVDHAETNVILCRKYAEELGLHNVSFGVATNPDEVPFEDYDAVICSEVLEHVPEPWQLIYDLEQHSKIGAKIIITVPQGPWEAIGLYDKEQFNWRAHIWHINKWMLRQMFRNKKDCSMVSLFNGHFHDGRMLGHVLFTYTSDHAPVNRVDPLRKADQARIRQTVAACVIAKNEQASIIKMLDSIGDQVQQVVVAVARGTSDMTCDLIEIWAKNHPWVYVEVKMVDDIEPGKFGFDDARNASIEYLDADWFLWIDCDEYVSGNFRRYFRNNAFDSYSINQHHFTCDPRGAPTMLDKPARFCRISRGFQFYGKVHEHAEKGFNGGPGFTFLMPDCDIGHTGYVNEHVRRGRFQRNYPLLCWDRDVNPERKLGKYLWLRDILHNMRYAAEQKDVNTARLLAEEAVSFYKDNWTQWDEAGMGGMSAVEYKSEALGFLGRGLPVQVAMKVNGEEFMAAGIFEKTDELHDLIQTAVKEKFNQRNSGYWQ